MKSYEKAVLLGFIAHVTGYGVAFHFGKPGGWHLFWFMLFAMSGQAGIITLAAMMVKLSKRKP